MGGEAGPWGAKLSVSVSMATSAACLSLLGQPPARQAVWEKAAGVEQDSSHVAPAPTPTWHWCCPSGGLPGGAFPNCPHLVLSFWVSPMLDAVGLAGGRGLAHILQNQGFRSCLGWILGSEGRSDPVLTQEVPPVWGQTEPGGLVPG